MTLLLLQSTRRSRVLIADRDADHRARDRAWFALADWDVAEAADGVIALEQLLITRTSLLVTELRLPLIDGISLCGILRDDPMIAAVPILVLSDDTRATEWARAAQAGADAVFVRPSTPDVIVNESRRLLNRAAARTRPKSHQPA